MNHCQGVFAASDMVNTDRFHTSLAPWTRYHPHRVVTVTVRPLSTTSATAAASVDTRQTTAAAVNVDKNGTLNDDGFRELVRWTETVLHPVRTPLGSIQPSTWKEVCMAMHLWLGQQNSMSHETQHSLSSTNSVPSMEPPLAALVVLKSIPPPPRHVDMIDRLLTRLWYEHNSTTPSHPLVQPSLSLPTVPSQTKRYTALFDWTVTVLSLWLAVSKRYSDAPMAVDKATHWYTILSHLSYHPLTRTTDPAKDDKDSNTNNHHKGVSATSAEFERLSVPMMFIEVVQAHQRLVDSVIAPTDHQHSVPSTATTTVAARTRAHSMCHAAAEMLLADATVRDIVSQCLFDDKQSSRLKVAYQTSLKQTLTLLSLHKTTAPVVAPVVASATAEDATRSAPKRSSNSIPSIELTHTASALLETMQRLALLPGWEDVRFHDEDLDAVLDVLFLDSTSAAAAATAATAPKKLSDFERQALQRRIITRIDQASTVHDQQTVEDLVVYWRSNMQDTERDTVPWKPFAKAVTSYYLKIQNPEKSTKWMQIQEQMPSAEVMVDAIQGSANQSSVVKINSDKAVDDTDENAKGNSFVELEALNRVFAENEIERVHQKMNLLDIWLTKVDSPIVPWRATEILESLESERDATLDPQIYVTIVKKWLDVHATKSAGVASDKAIEVALRCPSFNVEILSILMQLLVDRHAANDHRPVHSSAIFNFVDLIEQNLDDIPLDKRSSLIANAFRLLRTHTRSREFLDFVLERDIPVTSEIAEASVQWVPTNVESLLHVLEKSADTRTQFGFRFNCAAVRHLLQHPSKRHDIVSILLEAINSLRQGEEIVTARAQSYELAVLVTKVLDQILKEFPQDETSFETLLLKTEEVLLKTENNLDGRPVLLDFYNNLVVQLADQRMVDRVEKIVTRLKKHYRSGKADMFPSDAIHVALVTVMRDTDRLGSLNKRIGLLLELIAKYESTDKMDEWYKPSYQIFDRIVCDLDERAELAETEKEQIERDSRTAVFLLKKMHGLQIRPNKSNRVYPFNAGMNLVLACQHEHSHFEQVMTLKTIMDEMEMVPNFYTRQKILMACERAPKAKLKHQTFQAMTVMLQTLIEIRKLGDINPGTYSQCFRVLLALHEALTVKEKAHADSVLATVFQCCIDDGCLAHIARTNFRMLATRETFQRLYEERLQDGDEPKEWTRNVY